MVRVRLWVLAGAAAALLPFAASCGSDAAGVSGTLPPIVTTSTTTTELITSTTAPKYYVIQPGDTLQKIAEKFGVTQSQIIGLNGIVDKDHIEAGARIEIPTVDYVPPTTTTVAVDPGTTAGP